MEAEAKRFYDRKHKVKSNIRMYYMELQKEVNEKYHPSLDINSDASLNLVQNNIFKKQLKSRCYIPPKEINEKELRKKIKRLNRTAGEYRINNNNY